ncbi:MAG: glycosyltransferase [Phycisphaerales bacterium]|nr:glycosyltransferase [Phycisphaerales bacterium]
MIATLDIPVTAQALPPVSASRSTPQAPKGERDQFTRLKTGLTVLIPAYNEGKFVADTIRSVQSQSTPPAAIVVVDDCSSDNTGDVARACALPGQTLTVVRPEKNCGSKATALNYGMNFVETEFVLVIDADTTLAPDAIERLMPGFASQDVACVCGMVIPRRVRTLWERGRYVEYLYAFTFYKPIQDYYGRPLIASGCFSAFRTKILWELGGWQTRTVGEDMDLTWSIYVLGHKVRFALDAVCYPVEPHNFDFLNKQLRRWSHGFAQNVIFHWGKVLEVPYLRSIVTVALWDAVMAIIGLFILIPFLAIFVHPMFLLGYFLDLPAVAVPVLIQAAKRGEIGKALTSIPAFWLMRWVNCVYMMSAFWKEMVTKQKLHKFEKGH